MSEQRSARYSLVFVGAIALTSVACGDDNGVVPPGNGGAGGATTGGASGGGSGGTSGDGAAPVGTALSWGADGFIASDSNPFGIQGPFYSYSDCDPPSGLPCTAPDPSLTGADAKPGWSVDTGKVCMKGTAVQVEAAMFALQWGAGLALDLNSEGGEPGAPAVKGTFDLAKAKIRGFSLDISGAAPARIRINLTMPGVPDSSFVDAKIPGTTTFDIADAKQGSWVMQKTPLDPSKVEALQFQVFTTAASPTPYDFCVTAIRAVTDGAPPSASAGSGGGGG
jgi:hypothetical protein